MNLESLGFMRSTAYVSVMVDDRRDGYRIRAGIYAEVAGVEERELVATFVVYESSKSMLSSRVARLGDFLKSLGCSVRAEMGPS